MSNIAMQGGATGTGTVTLLAPSTSTNRTLTLPDVTGTVALQGGAGVGKVLQVVGYLPASSNGSTASTTPVSTTLSATITPTSATSKILVQAIIFMETGGAGNFSQATIYRGATNLAVVSNYMAAIRAPTIAYLDSMLPMQVLDSPATTSATTYTIYVISPSGSTTFWERASITLMEIAA